MTRILIPLSTLKQLTILIAIAIECFQIAFALIIWGLHLTLPEQQLSWLACFNISRLKDPARLPGNTPARSAGVGKGRGPLPARRLLGKRRYEAEQRRRHIDRVNSHVWADSLNGRCPGPVTAETLESYCQGYSVSECVCACVCVEPKPVDKMWLEEQNAGGEEGGF